MAEVKEKILTGKKFPFCPGCGHGVAVRQLAKVLEDAGIRRHDVVVVSDIGCSGLVDPLFDTHTIHGLHGRSPALGMGVAMGLDEVPGKKVITFIGDGGATIGLQHVLEAARRNVNMTLILLNNQVYGMTGGQISGLTTTKFKEIIDFEKDVPPFDIVKLAHISGARYAARVNSPKQMAEYLRKAIETEGFTLLEIASLCTSYAFKKLPEFLEVVEPEEAYENDRPPTRIRRRETAPLFEPGEGYEARYSSPVEERKGILLAGSAGGGVQSVGKFLATAGILAGLNTTMKGEYPITVGTGFSVAEVILDRDDIHYTGLAAPDVAVIVTRDGLEKVRGRLSPQTKVYLDESLEKDFDLPVRDVVVRPFGKLVSPKSKALLAAAWMLKREKFLPLEALRDVLADHRLSALFLPVLDKAVELE
ncbi:MAG: hypothetical protein GXO27_07495 [Chlorobi bacterium]|nr:hypothetical protein [Chlorobiota bacterium]